MSRIDDLYARYLEPLTHSLMRLGQREQDAADIAQETLIATWKRLEHVRPGAEWIYLKVAAHNKMRRSVAHAKAAVRGGGLLDPLKEDHDPENKRPTVEHELIARQEIEQFRARFNAVMAELPPETQQALALQARGLGSREIAKTLGLTDQAVRTRLSRAKATLRERVGKPPANVAWAALGDDDDHEN